MLAFEHLEKESKAVVPGIDLVTEFLAELSRNRLNRAPAVAVFPDKTSHAIQLHAQDGRAEARHDPPHEKRVPKLRHEKHNETVIPQFPLDAAFRYQSKQIPWRLFHALPSQPMPL